MQPENLHAVLPQYAANKHWELVHLAQFVADILLLVAFLAVYRSIVRGVSAALARVGMAVALVAEAIYSVVFSFKMYKVVLRNDSQLTTIARSDQAF